MTPGFLIATAALAAAPAARAQNADGTPCFPVPSTSTCTQVLVNTAQVQRTFLLARLQSRYTVAGKLTQADLGNYLNASDFIAGCIDSHPSCSSGYDIAVREDIGLGWTIERHFSFTGTAPGHCVLSEARSRDFLSYLAPDGSAVLTSGSLRSGGGRIYSAEGAATCHTADGGETERRFQVSDRGVLVIDWDDGPVSRHWGRRAEPHVEGPTRVTPVSVDTLRLTWPGGATIDFGTDGRPRGSNFLAAGAWDDASCSTGSEDGHVYPNLESVMDQSFGAIGADFVRN